MLHENENDNVTHKEAVILQLLHIRMTFFELTQAGGSVEVLLMTFITDAPADGNHPLPLSIAVHSRGRAPLCFTVGDTCPAQGHQGGRLGP